MGRAKSKRVKDFIRSQEYKRKCEIVKEKRQKLQEQITKDYVRSHAKIARKNDMYPLTEKVLMANSDMLQQLLSDQEILEINPLDYPEGLVL